MEEVYKKGLYLVIPVMGQEQGVPGLEKVGKHAIAGVPCRRFKPTTSGSHRYRLDMQGDRLPGTNGLTMLLPATGQGTQLVINMDGPQLWPTRLPAQL